MSHELAPRVTMRFVSGLRYTEQELVVVDAGYRRGLARCPIDEKPLLTTAWPDRTLRMVYFVCRQCSRIGAIAYPIDKPDGPGLIARQSRRSSRPPRQ